MDGDAGTFLSSGTDSAAGTAATADAKAATLPREWQRQLAQRTAPQPPVPPLWRTLLQNRAAVAILAGLVALLLLACVQPPFVQATSATPLEAGTLSVGALLTCAAVVAGAVFAAPYILQMFHAAARSCGE